MTTANSIITSSIPWMDSDLYNKLPDVYTARSAIDEKTQIAVASALITSIPELKDQIGIGIAHNHWTLNPKEHIIGHLENHTLYSKPQPTTTNICPITLGATKTGMVITEAIDNPSSRTLQVAKKIQECTSAILSFLPIEEGEEFSKLVVMINQNIIADTHTDCFLETNAKGMSVLTPTTKEEMKQCSEDTILTSVTVSPDRKGIQEVRCVSLCLGRDPNHIRSHAWEDPAPGGNDPIS